MQIHGSGQLHGAQGLQGPHWSRSAKNASPAAGPPAASDSLDISPAALAAADAADAPIRADVVARVREQIAAGTYESVEKLDAALERLLDEIG